MPTFEKKISPLEYKLIFKAYMDKEKEAEREYSSQKDSIVQNLEYVLAANGMSDHGMIEYLIDLWD